MAVKKLEYNNNIFLINYDILNNNQERVILFLHGWGSNKEIMKQAFSNKLKSFKHIYIDMPGFGRSLNDNILTTNDYKNIINLFLEILNINKTDISILGHSFGGKVATLLEPKNLILCSSAGILEPKPFFIRLKIILSKIFKFFGIGQLTKYFRSKDVDKMSQNMYETFKNVVDEDFTNIFKNVKSNCLIFWGEQDSATSINSGKIINNLIKTSYFVAYQGNHFFFIDNSDKICAIMEQKLE